MKFSNTLIFIFILHTFSVRSNDSFELSKQELVIAQNFMKKVYQLDINEKRQISAEILNEISRINFKLDFTTDKHEALSVIADAVSEDSKDKTIKRLEKIYHGIDLDNIKLGLLKVESGLRLGGKRGMPLSFLLPNVRTQFRLGCDPVEYETLFRPVEGSSLTYKSNYVSRCIVGVAKMIAFIPVDIIFSPIHLLFSLISGDTHQSIYESSAGGDFLSGNLIYRFSDLVEKYNSKIQSGRRLTDDDRKELTSLRKRIIMFAKRLRESYYTDSIFEGDTDEDGNFYQTKEHINRSNMLNVALEDIAHLSLDKIEIIEWDSSLTGRTVKYLGK